MLRQVDGWTSFLSDCNETDSLKTCLQKSQQKRMNGGLRDLRTKAVPVSGRRRARAATFLGAAGARTRPVRRRPTAACSSPTAVRCPTRRRGSRRLSRRPTSPNSSYANTKRVASKVPLRQRVPRGILDRKRCRFRGHRKSVSFLSWIRHISFPMKH